VSSNLTAPTIFINSQMSSDPKNHPADFQRLFRMHDEVMGAFRAELAQRSAGEVLYDACLLDQLRKGKPFKIAVRKANAKFPAEALNASGEELADAEEHYRFFLRMEEIDGHRRAIEECDKRIAEKDREIAAVMESIAADQAMEAPGSPPQAVQGS
jgi:hypothetical protein